METSQIRRKSWHIYRKGENAPLKSHSHPSAFTAAHSGIHTHACLISVIPLANTASFLPQLNQDALLHARSHKIGTILISHQKLMYNYYAVFHTSVNRLKVMNKWNSLDSFAQVLV